MLSGNSSNHLQFFLSKITENKPFSFIRPNDGEYDLLYAIQQFSESPNGYWHPL